jgi:hypothetical protein
MKKCNSPALLLATSSSLESSLGSLPPGLSGCLLGPLLAIVRLIAEFSHGQVSPESAWDFEQRLEELLREVGRCCVERVYNHCEPDDPGLLPAQMELEGVWYRRNDRKTANRNVATLFGKITLMRYLYRPIEELVPCIFPLEMRLGLAAARATAALAGRVGLYAAQCTQRTVLQALARDHGVAWSASTLRKVTAAVARGMTQHRRAAQVAKLLELLREAGGQAILCVGRDGIFTPIRKLHRGYCEAAVATVSVLNHLGKRLGTVYLGHMPQEGQGTLSDQLTSLILEVLRGWDGPLPRLVYVTDAGHHQTKYFKKLLRRLRHPLTGRRLRWEWVLDYYHACQYITDLAEALFGQGRHATAWAAKMRRWLKEKPKGIHRVLHSAAALRNLRGLSGTAKAFDDAYNYLRKRIGHLNYHGYRRRRLPIGSGVTEACCKTVVTQRMKQSGMTWKLDGGQTIMDLRVIYLSGIWEDVYAAHLRATEVKSLRTQVGETQGSGRNAA